MKFKSAPELYEAIKGQVELHDKKTLITNEEFMHRTDENLDDLDIFLNSNKGVEAIMGLLDTDIGSLTSKDSSGRLFIPQSLRYFLTEKEVMQTLHSNENNTFGLSVNHGDCSIYSPLSNPTRVAKVVKYRKSNLFVPDLTFDEDEIDAYFGCVDYLKSNNMKADNDFIQATRFLMGILAKRYSYEKPQTH